jgi:hypothetical protein
MSSELATDFINSAEMMKQEAPAEFEECTDFLINVDLPNSGEIDF